MKPLVELEGVGKRFGKRTVLQEVSLALPAHGVTVLLGPNGAGKSTLMRLVLGLLAPDAGRIRVFGLDPLRHGERVRESAGYVPDQPDVPAWMTPRELFRFLAPLYPTWSSERVARLAAEYEIPLDTSFRRLSRGQAARAMLAAALASSPRLLVLDECFSGLDPVARRDLLGHFAAELAREETCALLATHDLDVAARIADHVIVLHEGRVSAAGSLEEVLGGDENLVRLPARLLELLEAPGEAGEREQEEVAA
jgi:ABC-2 type transport system ATP-binding protein